jgi:putative transposase
MKKSRYSDSQIMIMLKQGEAEIPVPELCREHGMSTATFYKWRSRYGGMDASMMSRLKELEDENRRLKRRLNPTTFGRCHCLIPIFRLTLGHRGGLLRVFRHR